MDAACYWLFASVDITPSSLPFPSIAADADHRMLPYSVTGYRSVGAVHRTGPTAYTVVQCRDILQNMAYGYSLLCSTIVQCTGFCRCTQGERGRQEIALYSADYSSASNQYIQFFHHIYSAFSLSYNVLSRQLKGDIVGTVGLCHIQILG